MPVPEGSAPDASPPLFASLRSFWSVLVAILYTRLDLATTELEDEGIRLVKLIAAALFAALSLFVAFFFAMFFLLALVWDTAFRLWFIGGIFAIYLLGAVLFFLLARDMIFNRPKFLSQTLAELRRDVESLRQTAARKEETQP